MGLWTPPKARRLESQDGSGGGRLRLFICNICQTIEELPYFEGDPDRDVLLQDRLRSHGHARISTAGRNADVRVAVVERTWWDDSGARKKIIDQIREAENHTGLGDEYYATRDTYREEALKCYSAHRRPEVPPGCVDYKDSTKLLGNTLQDAADVREAGDDVRRALRDARPKVYLCNFCPVHSMVLQRMRDG